ncbi:MAG: hypothetical protein Q9201_005354 [Fulgogasparrea decipioides]
MPPIRRYLRITQYSVLECRIYLDNPADAQRWLLNERSPVLPRVIEAVRPLVLPKLREENAKAKLGKSGKRKGWKDVVVEGTAAYNSLPYGHLKAHGSLDDFEVAVFLTEISSRHAILHKEKRAKTEKPSLGTTNRILTGEGTRDVPIEVGETKEPIVLREESQDDKLLELANIPAADESQGQEPPTPDASLFISDGSDHESGNAMRQRRTNSSRQNPARAQGPEDDDKKKLALNTSYDGFSIYGRILCLVVKRRGKAKGEESAGAAGQAMMEEWIASTQTPDGQMTDD